MRSIVHERHLHDVGIIVGGQCVALADCDWCKPWNVRQLADKFMNPWRVAFAKVVRGTLRMAPIVKKFELSSNLVKAVRLDSSEGIVPVNEFFMRDRKCNFINLPMELGMEPMRELSLISKLVKLWKSSIPVGIEPVKPRWLMLITSMLR